MKKIFTLFFIGWMYLGYSQSPVIEGDVLMCPWTDGTAAITGTQTYDSYKWYYKYWFTPDPFVEIPGANGPSFTYDWYTYDQALLKVEVTLGGNTYESNTIQIDSWNWVSMSVGYELNDNAVFDPETESISLCPGGSFPAEIFSPYSANIQWYRDDVAIDGANDMHYVIAAAGTYTVTAAPPFCPDNESTSLPIYVTMNPDCNLGVNDPANNLGLKAYPNPVNDYLSLSAARAIESVEVYNMAGQLVHSQKVQALSGNILMTSLPAGVYVIEVKAEGTSKKMKIIKA